MDYVPPPTVQHFSKNISIAPFPLARQSVDILGLDPELTLLIGNNGDQGKTYVYDITGNFLADEVQIPEGMIKHAVKVSSNVFLIAHENGIYKYDHSARALTLWLSGADAGALAFDDLRQFVYLSTDNTVYIYRYDDAALLQEVIMPHEVLNILMQYNK